MRPAEALPVLALVDWEFFFCVAMDYFFPFGPALHLQVVSDFFFSQVLSVCSFFFDWVG